jgi:hypothetical protein
MRWSYAPCWWTRQPGHSEQTALLDEQTLIRLPNSFTFDTATSPLFYFGILDAASQAHRFYP